MKGLTFQIVVGKWAKPSLRRGDKIYGICLGWIAISFILYDMEVYVVSALKMLNDLQKKQIKITLPSDEDIEKHFISKGNIMAPFRYEENKRKQEGAKWFRSEIEKQLKK